MHLSSILNKNGFVCAIILVIGLTVYFPVINGPFLFDDDLFIIKNKQVHSLANIPQMLVSSTSDRALDTHSNFYRPIQQICYAFLYALFGPNSMPFHLFSILLHCFNAFLLFVLITKMIGNRFGALMGCLLFLIHPINTESVCYISGLADVVGMFFMLICSILVIKTFTLVEKFWVYAIGAIGVFTLALLSKENLVILLPFLLLLYYFFYSSITGQQQHVRIRSLMGIFTILTVTYIILKFSVFNFTGNTGLSGEKDIYTENLYVRIFTFIHIFPEYLRMIFVPLELNYEKPYTAYTDLKSAQSIIGLLSLFVIGGLAIFAFIRKYKTLAFSACWIMVALAPYSGIIPLNATYLEHWLYFPLIGFCIMLTVLINKASGFPQTIITLLLVFIFVLGGFRTAVRASEWASVEKFYANELKHTQDAVRIYNNLAMYYAENKKPQKAIQYYEKALKIKDAFPQVHHNMGNLYRDMGDTNKAIEEYYKALRLNPNFYYSLGEMTNICLDNKLNERAYLFKTLYDRASTEANVTPLEIENAFASH
jgi:tetratricopeptide (TPR) repeat protein